MSRLVRIIRPARLAAARGGDCSCGGTCAACGAPPRQAALATLPFAAPFPVPEYQPAEWFMEPPDWIDAWRAEHGYPPARDETGILRLTVTDDGRAGGYFYEHGQCILDGRPGCWTPPPSPTRYAAFHQASVVLEDGTALEVGVIGNIGGHASPFMRLDAAQRKYADPNVQKLVMRAVDDERGGYVVGAVVPGLTYGDIALLRRSSLSGDWRPMPDEWFKGNGITHQAAARADYYDCVAPALITNPGIPLVRAYARRASLAPVYLGGAGGVQLDDEALEVDMDGDETAAGAATVTLPDGTRIEFAQNGQPSTVPDPAHVHEVAPPTVGDAPPVAPEPSADDPWRAAMESTVAGLRDDVATSVRAAAAKLPQVELPPPSLPDVELPATT